jgi:hypothetical protein
MLRIRELISLCAIICGCVFFLLGQSQPADAGQAASQVRHDPIPDTFTNLQVLPKTIAKPQLVAIMKSFSITMKVRCSHCHVATDDLSQADFAADEKPTKKDARELLRNVLQAQKPGAQ